MADSFGDVSPQVGTFASMVIPKVSNRRSVTVWLAATSLFLIWGTAFDGRSAGPVRAVLVALPYGDKVGHFVLYGLIMFGAGLLVSQRSAVFVAAALVIGAGVADEFRQLLEGGRNFSLGDVLANVAGVLFGLLAALAIRRLVPPPEADLVTA